MDRHTHRSACKAYTLIELLVIVFAVFALFSLFMPVLSHSRRTARSVVCISNLGQLADAHESLLIENHNDQEMTEMLSGATGSWPYFINAHLNEEKINCPESETAFGTATLSQLMIAVHEDGNIDGTGQMTQADFDKVKYFMDVDPDRRWIHKLGWDQYQDYRTLIESQIDMSLEEAAMSADMGLAVTYIAIDYFENDYQGFEPGDDPDHFVLLVEDMRLNDYNSANIGHNNHLDFIIFVEPVPDQDDKVKVTAQHYFRRSLDAGFLAWFDTKEQVYEDGIALRPQDSRSIIVEKDSGSYGANPKRLFKHRQENRILFLDYQNVLASRNNWDRWDNESGVPFFARHPRDTMNVAFMDGSVRNMQVSDIDPTISINEDSFW